MLDPKIRWITALTALVFLCELPFTTSTSLAAEGGKQSLPPQVKLNGNSSSAQPKAPKLPVLIGLNSNGGGCGNNGHGNDPDRNDASNPGKSRPNDGTDADGTPGNGKRGDNKGNCGVSRN